MNDVAKFVFASVFALSAAVPAFAAHTSKMGESAEHPRVERVHPRSAMDARSYAPEDVPFDARAYSPNETPIESGPDFGIGSQR